MRTLDISARLLGEAVWRSLFETSTHRLFERRQKFFELMASLEALRARADYDTGSISAASAWALFSLSHYFGAKYLLEIGTFIGKSTLALALGADDARTGIELHTCDMSNAVELPSVSRCTVRQYTRTSSTDMLRQIASNHAVDRPFELLHVDGRLQSEDLALLQSVCTPNLVVALDDFEGVEKGIANLVNMRSVGFLNSHLLIPPCPERLLREFGFPDHSSTALLIPQSALRMTAQ
jgi:predicted O-methyltransferase YrrM